MSGNSKTSGLNNELSQLIQIYREEILPQKTRAVHLLGRKCEPRIMYTFLGFELKLGRKRINCPDISTARYLRIFAEIGMDSIRIPYDPTRTARLLPDLETPFFRIKEFLLQQDYPKAEHQQALRRVYKRIREGLRRKNRKPL
ncbi:MAG: hypothetical protein ACRD1R_11380 [Acidobacteriota bacterium]